jgi:hypothetical protein
MSDDNVQNYATLSKPIDIRVSFANSFDLISDVGVECEYDDKGTLSYQTWFQASSGGGSNYYEKLVDLYKTKGFEELIGEDVEKYKPREHVDFRGFDKSSIVYAIAENVINRPIPAESGRIKVDIHPRELLDYIKENDPFNQVLSPEKLKLFEGMVVDFEGSVETYNKASQANNAQIPIVKDSSEVVLHGQNPGM